MPLSMRGALGGGGGVDKGEADVVEEPFAGWSDAADMRDL